MDPVTIGALLSGGSSIIGNLIGSSNVNQNNATQMAIAQQNIALQKEFAQHGIQWKVEDAKAAGLHPLAALGAQTSSFSPVSVGTEAHQPDLSQLGQDLSRAFKASASQEAREEADAEKARKLDLAGKQLDNVAKADAITSRRASQIGPPMPTAAGEDWNRLLAHLDRSPERSGGFPVSDDKIKTAPVYANEAARFNYFGVPFRAHPGTADAQFFENRYGEEHPITKMAGWGIAAADVLESLKQIPAPDIRGRDSPKYRRVRGAARGF